MGTHLIQVYKSIYCGYSFELSIISSSGHGTQAVIQFLDCMLIGVCAVCAVIRSM